MAVINIDEYSSRVTKIFPAMCAEDKSLLVQLNGDRRRFGNEKLHVSVIATEIVRLNVYLY